MINKYLEVIPFIDSFLFNIKQIDNLSDKDKYISTILILRQNCLNNKYDYNFLESNPDLEKELINIINQPEFHFIIKRSAKTLLKLIYKIKNFLLELL